MTKKATNKYPTLRVRVSQEMHDKAYRTGWPESVKEFINNTKEKENEQYTKIDKKSISKNASATA